MPTMMRLNKELFVQTARKLKNQIFKLNRNWCPNSPCWNREKFTFTMLKLGEVRELLFEWISSELLFKLTHLFPVHSCPVTWDHYLYQLVNLHLKYKNKQYEYLIILYLCASEYNLHLTWSDNYRKTCLKCRFNFSNFLLVVNGK